ncbi:MAG: hypothetical protein AAB731_04880, partial [Patescibacteria group bacterium]
ENSAPPLGDNLKIFISAKYLYALDKKEKRIIAYKLSDGKISAQYQSETFDDLTDFSVDERAKKIYILNNDTVYGLIANHLN